MIEKINGEQPFQILSDAFTIGPSQTGYDLQISANGTDYSTLFSVAANTTRLVNNVSNGAFFRLKNNVGEVDVNWRTTCKSGGSGGGSGSGGTDTGTVQTMINQSLSNYTANLEEGEPIVGMAAQLYSPDGVEVEGAFTYRTTSGDADVSSAPAELRKVEGNSIYPELQYNDSASLERGGSEVTGFTYDIEWGDYSEWVAVQGSDSFRAKKVKIKDPSGYPGVWLSNGSYYQLVRSEGNTYGTWHYMSDISGDGTRFLMGDNLGEAYVDEDYIVFEVYDDNVWVAVSLCDSNAGQGAAICQTNVIPNDIPAGESTYTYDDATSAWTPTLPQAIQNMQIDGSDYEPQDGDEITINRSLYREGRAQFSNPRTFVSVGLNSFCATANTPISSFEYDEENDNYKVVVRAVEGVEYTIFNPSGSTTIDGAWAQPSKNVAVGSWSTDGDYKVFTPTGDPNIVNEGGGEGDHSSVFAEFDYYDGEADANATLFLEWNVNWEVEEDERYGWWSVQIGDPDGEYEYVMSLDPDGEDTYQFDANADGDKYNLVWDGTTLKFFKTDTNEDVYPMTMDMLTPVLSLEPHNETGDGVHIEIENGYPYILITTTDKDTLCVHPMWSGYMDEVYEPYEESRVENLFTLVAVCPMRSVGNVRNIIDIEGGQLIYNIGSEEYSAARVNELLASGYTLGVDFEFDSTLIYKVLDTPVINVITFDGSYDANDFGVEYFLDADGIIPTPLYATTYYMNNLVDKLRRMEGLVHLDSMSGTGSDNTLYENEGKLYMWSDEGGTVAEWTDNPSVLGNDMGYGMIFSHIPNGQKLFEIKYPYGGEWRYVVMSGDTLVLTETGGTVVTSCTIGNTVNFPCSQYGNIYYVKVKYESHYIGFWFTNYCNKQNVWDGTVTGGHFVMVDHTNYPFLDISTTADGMPMWNSKGQIIKKVRKNSSKGIQFNTNASQYSSTGKIEFLTDGTNNGPSRMFVPTQGGTAGQMLISAGDNAEPTWTNWIKSVQITSDDYEALQVKDPSTLYLIVDE